MTPRSKGSVKGTREIANRIRYFRKLCGLSQKRLPGHSADHQGMSRATFYRRAAELGLIAH